MQEPLILSDDWQEALDELEHSQQHFFITGKAGTGKSTLLQLFRKTTRKKVVVLAPTGVAALNVEGQTIHSFFGFAPRLLTHHDIERRRNRTLLKKMEVLVIDEISMVRAEMLDNIDYALRINRDRDELFGGVQMIFIGDLLQLPPVVATPYEKQYFQSVYNSPYFFSAKVFEKGFRMHTIELRKVYRQAERRFINLLECIRSGDIDEDVLQELNNRVSATDGFGEQYITLTARNNVANVINNKALNQLDTQAYQYKAHVTGQFSPSLFPTEAILTLKPGAQVMFVKNDPLKKYVNGTIGIVSDLTDESIKVEVEDDSGKKITIDVDRQEWELLRYSDKRGEDGINTETIGSFHQYPLKLAWAITVHKSQGKTFDKVIIDLGGGAFEHGQTYVALSRCRTLEGIKLKRPIKYRDILVDERIMEFYDQIRRY